MVESGDMGIFSLDYDSNEYNYKASRRLENQGLERGKNTHHILVSSSLKMWMSQPFGFLLERIELSLEVGMAISSIRG